MCELYFTKSKIFIDYTAERNLYTTHFIYTRSVNNCAIVKKIGKQMNCSLYVLTLNWFHKMIILDPNLLSEHQGWAYTMSAPYIPSSAYFWMARMLNITTCTNQSTSIKGRGVYSLYSQQKTGVERVTLLTLHLIYRTSHDPAIHGSFFSFYFTALNRQKIGFSHHYHYHLPYITITLT